MFGKALRLLSRNKEAESSPPPSPGVPVTFPKGGLVKLINPAGRISLTLLQRMVSVVAQENFVRFIQAPCLVGSAIHMGTLDMQPRKGPREMNSTILFEPASADADAAEPSEGLKHAIYPLIRGESSIAAVAVFTVGRVDGNSFIMPDYAISKKHAAIEVRRGSYLVKDYGSTNGTLLNGQRLQDKPQELHDGDIISFARYEFAFLSPDALYRKLRLT
jgi:hypothetical protein